MRLVTKLSLTFILITLGCGVATSAIVSSFYLKSMERERIEDVEVVVDSLAHQLADGIINRDSVAVREILLGLISSKWAVDFAYLVQSDGTLLAHTFGEKLPEGLPRLTSQAPPRDGPGALVRFELNQNTYLIAHHPLLEGTSLGVVHVGINRSAVMEDVRSLTILIMTTSLAVALIGVLAASYAAVRFTRPLRQLSNSILAYGSGAADLPGVEPGGTEIRELSGAFQEMVASRNRAEAALRFQGALLDAENASILDGVLIVSPERKVLYHNSQFRQLWSLPAELTAEDDEALLARVLEQLEDREGFLEKLTYLYGHPAETSLDEIALRDGRIMERYSAPIADSSGNDYGRIWFFRDITERKRSEAERLELKQQMLHVQKFESLGVLAGGIAHDFNNILMAIMGNNELAMMELGPRSPVIDKLKKVEQAAERAADLARQMLAYSGRGKFLVTQVDLNTVIEEMRQILEASISKKVRLDLLLSRPLPTVEADASQMRQIIMNLVINASEAIGDGTGVITLTTGTIECDKQYLGNIWQIDELQEGAYNFIEVADTGCGMDRDILEKLFDPFFSTKFTGRGLGMSAVLGIVRGHKGGITVYSEPGSGSCFKVLLPAGGKPVGQVTATADDAGCNRGGVVLLVDDEEEVRQAGSAMLRELGQAVITAADGKQAIELYRGRSDISLVVLDLTMPQMDGVECFRELRRLDPGVRVIMSSGYSEQEVARKIGEAGGCGFIQKPYRLVALKNALTSITALPALP